MIVTNANLLREEVRKKEEKDRIDLDKALKKSEKDAAKAAKAAVTAAKAAEAAAALAAAREIPTIEDMLTEEVLPVTTNDAEGRCMKRKRTKKVMYDC